MIEIKRFSFDHDWTTFPIEKFDETKTSFTISYRGGQDWFLVVTHGVGSQTIHVPFAGVVKLLKTSGVKINEINNFSRTPDFVDELVKLFSHVITHGRN